MMIKKGWALWIFDNRNRIEPKALDRGIARRAERSQFLRHRTNPSPPAPNEPMVRAPNEASGKMDKAPNEA
jgi:hypothetical protein